MLVGIIEDEILGRVMFVMNLADFIMQIALGRERVSTFQFIMINPGDQRTTAKTCYLIRPSLLPAKLILAYTVQIGLPPDLPLSAEPPRHLNCDID